MEIIANFKLLSAILAEAILTFLMAFIAGAIAAIVTACIVISLAFIIDVILKVAGKPATLGNTLMYFPKEKSMVIFIAISALFGIAFFATGTSLF